MPTIPAIGRRNQLVDELKQVLQALRNTSRRKKYCERCGSPMTQLSAHFWLDGLDETWEVTLPYCAECNPEVGNRGSFAA